MIRLRIERIFFCEDIEQEGNLRHGLIWYEDGEPVGRVIIEQTETMGPFGDSLDPDWEPVEVIDES